MIQHLRQISVLNKIFNLEGNEWPKLSIAWLISFFYRVGFVIGWTTIVGLFVAKYGISFLPYLLVINAFFSILGSFFFASVLNRFRKDILMIVALILAAVTLTGAAIISQYSEILFFALLIVGEAMFLTQFRTISYGYTEEMFTPLESERTFPLIEAAETIGGIIAGILITSFSNIDPHNFVFIWVALIVLIIPCLLLHEKRKVLKLSLKANAGFFSQLKEEFSHSDKAAFVKGLCLIVFLNWVLFNLLDFQYTKAIYQSVSNVIIESGSGFEHAFVHGLGKLFIVFSSIALIFQLFVGSRIINSLGIVGSMLLHPLVTLLSLIGFLFNFGYSTAVLARTNFTITNVLQLNSYHSSYYAVGEKIREHVRMFTEGMLRPLGAIIGMLGLILLQRFFADTQLIFYVNLLMIIVALTLLVIVYLQQNKYTSVATHELLHASEKENRFEAIEILAQKGHKESCNSLIKVLENTSEPVCIRTRILHALGSLQEYDAIRPIIKCFKSENAVIREVALDALMKFKQLKPSREHLLIEHEFVEALKKLFKEEKDDQVRSKIIVLLSKLSLVATFEFLLDLLNSNNNNLKADALYALGNYKDTEVIKFIKPSLKSKDPLLKMNAAIALGKFKEHEDESLYLIYSFLYSEDKKLIGLGLYAIGELRLKSKKKLCLKYLESSDKNLKIHACVALAKMGYNESIPKLIDLIFFGDLETSRKVKLLLRNVDMRISKNIDKIINHMVNLEISKLLQKAGNKPIHELPNKYLSMFHRLYLLAEEYDEVEKINSLLTMKQISYNAANV